MSTSQESEFRMSKKSSRRTLLLNTIGVLLAGCVAGSAMAAAPADKYPERALRIVVPYAAGGGTDILARRIANDLSKRLGQPVIIDNRPGAGTIIGADVVAKAAPDGYTMLMTASAFSVLPALYSNMPFDPVRDFEPVTLFANSPNVLLVNTTVPAKNLKEFLTLAKERTDPLNYGSSGNGGTGHLGMELLKQKMNIQMVHIPYASGAPAMQALLGGQVSAVINNITASVPQIKGGKVRALAVTTLTRSPALPDVPSIAEAGGPPDFEIAAWFGAFVPAKTPVAIVRRLNAEINAVVRSAEVQKLFAEQGVDSTGSSPEEFTQIIRAEVPRWMQVLKAAKIKVD